MSVYNYASESRLTLFKFWLSCGNHIEHIIPEFTKHLTNLKICILKKYYQKMNCVVYQSGTSSNLDWEPFNKWILQYICQIKMKKWFIWLNFCNAVYSNEPLLNVLIFRKWFIQTDGSLVLFDQAERLQWQITGMLDIHSTVLQFHFINLLLKQRKSKK